SRPPRLLRFVLHATVTTAIYTLSLHDALPIFFRSSFSTSISVRSVSFRMSASRRTSSASMPLSFFSLGAVFGSAIGASCPCLNRSEEHTSELQSRENLVCRLLLEKKKNATRRR